MPSAGQLWFPTDPNAPPTFPAPTAPTPTGTTPTAGTTTPFNINPGPLSGTNPFGYIPGPVTTPNPYQDLGAVYPNLGATNTQVSGDLLNQLKGVLSPETQAAIQDAAARFGITSGMPGSGLVHNRTARDLGLTTEQLQQQGLQNYGSLIPTISHTQTVSPAEQIALAQWNAINRSAPDPTQAANYAQQLFNQYLNRMRGPQGGTGMYASPSIPPGLMGGGATGAGGSGGFPFAAPGSGGVADPYAVSANDPLSYMFGFDPEAQNWLQGTDPYAADMGGAPPGTVTTPDASLAPGSMGTYYNTSPDLFSGQDFYDLGGF